MFPLVTLEVSYTVWTLRVFLIGKEQNMLMLEATQKAFSCFPLCPPSSCPWPSLPLWPKPKDSKQKKQRDHPRSAGKYCYKQASNIKLVIASNKQKRALQAGPWEYGHLVKIGREEQRMACLSSCIHQYVSKILREQGYSFHITHSNDLNSISKVIPLQ